MVIVINYPGTEDINIPTIGFQKFNDLGNRFRIFGLGIVIILKNIFSLRIIKK